METPTDGAHTERSLSLKLKIVSKGPLMQCKWWERECNGNWSELSL